MRDAARIADALTESQRRQLLRAEPDGQLGNLFIRSRWDRDGGRAAMELHVLGLTTIVWSGLMLNATGAAVRQNLL